MKKSKGILIDVEKKEFREVEFSYEDMCGLIECEVFTSIRISQDTHIFVDDNGLLTGRTKGFLLPGATQPIMGNGLVSSCDGAGETVDVSIPVSLVEANITFVDFDDPSLVPVPDIRVISFGKEEE
jgi:hypothetical protein